MTRLMITAPLTFVAALFALGCSSAAVAPDDAGSKPADSGETGATFTTVYTKVIEGYKCTTCHIPTGIGVTVGDLDMSTQALAYKNLVGVKAAGKACGTSGLTRVVPGDAAHSLIIEKTETSVTKVAPPCGVQMPDGCGKTPGLHCLGNDDIAPLESWINAGAQDN